MTTDPLSHLTALAGFLDKKAARRWRARATTKAGWPSLSATFAHAFDPLTVFRIDCAKWTADRVRAELRAWGAPETVCCIGGGFEEDDTFMPLDEAVDAVFGYLAGQVISCIPGQLAYYESGEQGVRMILRR